MMKSRIFLSLLLLGSLAVFCAAQEKTPADPSIVLTRPGYRLEIDTARGSIESFRATYGVPRDLLIPKQSRLPLFKIEFLDDHSTFRTVTAAEANEVHVEKIENAAEDLIKLDFAGVGQLPVDVHVTIRCPRNSSLTYWNLELNNRTDMWVGHIQFPVIEVPFDQPGEKSSSHILWSFADGQLAGPVQAGMQLGPWGGTERDSTEIWRYNNYPGEWTSTQLMAYYNEAGGLYVACDDPTGLPKFIDPLMENDGVTMGLGHYPGTRGPGITKLPYNVVLGTFHGDWYAAAEIYRNWASKQPFCARKIADRKDYPAWITKAAVGITFPMRGQGDWDPPAAVNREYTPATHALPYLDKLASALESPLMPIIFNWEHGGPWVQPDAFPPIGGEVPMREFMTQAKAKGWHPVLYGDGLTWVTWQRNTNYDGLPYFHSHGGDQAVVRKWDGTLREDRLGNWRKNYIACVGTAKGRQMVIDMTRRMAELGPSVIQQFDQGPGPVACYAKDHGHPPVPGPWMTEAFNQLVGDDTTAARSADPSVAMSCEGAPPETYLQDFQIWDARAQTTPLYSFLYHEYANGHEGFYTNRVNDEALRLSAARAFVTGYIVNFTLRDKGQIEYDWDQTWDRAIPDQSAILDWAKRITQLRAGAARDFLVYGKMLRPWIITGVTERDFGWGKEPLVQSATWQAPDGRVGIVLANVANLAEAPRLELPGQGAHSVTINLDGTISHQEMQLPAVLNLAMRARSLALVEVR